MFISENQRVRLIIMKLFFILFTIPSTIFCQSSLKGFILDGDPASSAGATWTLQDTIDGVVYDLSGILFKPAGIGMFPAIILSHGGGENVAGFPTTWAHQMVTWGLVCIATNYTHSSGVPIGSPGTSSKKGASTQNIQRGFQCWRILASLGYVDTTRIAAHGFSLGAFTSAALVGAYPSHFRAASHAGGGIGTWGSATKLAQVVTITAPYQMHHGDADEQIPYTWDVAFDTTLQSVNIAHQLCTYPGALHMAVSNDSVMMTKIRQWYTQYGVVDSSTATGARSHGELSPSHFELNQNYPNPFNPSTNFMIRLSHPAFARLTVYDLLGKEVATLLTGYKSPGTYYTQLNGSQMASGVYFARLDVVAERNQSTTITKKISLIR